MISQIGIRAMGPASWMTPGLSVGRGRVEKGEQMAGERTTWTPDFLLADCAQTSFVCLCSIRSQHWRGHLELVLRGFVPRSSYSFYTFSPANFSSPFSTLSRSTDCPWVSEDVGPAAKG